MVLNKSVNHKLINIVRYLFEFYYALTNMSMKYRCFKHEVVKFKFSF